MGLKSRCGMPQPGAAALPPSQCHQMNNSASALDQRGKLYPDPTQANFGLLIGVGNCLPIWSPGWMLCFPLSGYRS